MLMAERILRVSCQLPVASCQLSVASRWAMGDGRVLVTLTTDKSLTVCVQSATLFSAAMPFSCLTAIRLSREVHCNERRNLSKSLQGLQSHQSFQGFRNAYRIRTACRRLRRC